jgi:hypothetical protein
MVQGTGLQVHQQAVRGPCCKNCPRPVSPRVLRYELARDRACTFGGRALRVHHQALLSTVGVGPRSETPLTATINWSLKDGAGRWALSLCALGHQLDCGSSSSASSATSHGGGAILDSRSPHHASSPPPRVPPDVMKEPRRRCLITRAPISCLAWEQHGRRHREGASIPNLSDIAGHRVRHLPLAPQRRSPSSSSASLSCGFHLSPLAEKSTPVILPFLSPARLAYATGLLPRQVQKFGE